MSIALSVWPPLICIKATLGARVAAQSHDSRLGAVVVQASS